MRISWKIHRLTKILSWHVTKWGLFYNIVTLAVHTLLLLVLQCSVFMGKKNQQKIWRPHMNISAYELFSPPSYLSINLSKLFSYLEYFYLQTKVNVQKTFHERFSSYLNVAWLNASHENISNLINWKSKSYKIFKLQINQNSICMIKYFSIVYAVEERHLFKTEVSIYFCSIYLSIYLDRQTDIPMNWKCTSSK